MTPRPGIFVFVLLLTSVCLWERYPLPLSLRFQTVKWSLREWIPSQGGETYRSHTLLTGQHVVGRTC